MDQEQLYRQFLLKNRYPRQLVNYEMTAGFYLESNGKSLINFSSNDYLGLSKHPLLIERVQDYAKRFGIGSGSSRLVAGNSRLYDELEGKLAAALNKPAALILGTGYQTNFTVLEGLLDEKVLTQKPLVFCDQFCHTSIISSVRHSAEVNHFRHNDLKHLEELLDRNHHLAQPKYIFAESIYSMDGDRLDLEKITALAKQYGAMLYIDDAHSVGVCGPDGWGNAAQYAGQIGIMMGTFSKALGSFGGYIACSETVKDYLINKCRGLIYSTALPIPILGAISAAIELVPQMAAARKKLISHSKKLLTFFKENQINCGAADSHIIPWIIGDSKKTLYASELLKQAGILGVTIRPPSVSLGQSRIRFCLSAAHEEKDLEKLMAAIVEVQGKCSRIK